MLKLGEMIGMAHEALAILREIRDLLKAKQQAGA